MTQTVDAAVANDAGPVRVRAFLNFAGGLNAGSVLDRDQATRLARDITAIDAFATLQARRYEMAAADNARLRREAILEQSRAHEQHLQLEHEHNQKRADYASANSYFASAGETLQRELAEARDAHDEYLRAAEDRAAAAENWWNPILVVRAISDIIAERVENAENAARVAQDEVYEARNKLDRARSECDSVLAQIKEVFARIASCDETLARVDAATRKASDAFVVADAAEHFCVEMSYFLKSRAEDEIDAHEFMTQLDSPLESISTDGPPLTGRMALERLVTLAETRID